MEQEKYDRKKFLIYEWTLEELIRKWVIDIRIRDKAKLFEIETIIRNVTEKLIGDIKEK